MLQHALKHPREVQFMLDDVATMVVEGGHDSSCTISAQSFGLGYSKACPFPPFQSWIKA